MQGEITNMITISNLLIEIAISCCNCSNRRQTMVFRRGPANDPL